MKAISPSLPPGMPVVLKEFKIPALGFSSDSRFQVGLSELRASVEMVAAGAGQPRHGFVVTGNQDVRSCLRLGNDRRNFLF